jgi:cobyrinic acid a,c-diamide synthase
MDIGTISASEAGVPAVIVAGTHSGSGKTIVTLAVLAALARRGWRVQGFKVGPDFIDPGHHTAITSRTSRNLDTWLLDPIALAATYRRATQDADLAVIEGVMGLFDGRSALDEAGSTADLARAWGLPVVLVVDARGLAKSIAPLVRGFATFDPRVRVAGVIANRAGSARHYAEYLAPALRAAATAEPLGYLLRDEALAIPARHLGLWTADEFRPGASFATAVAAAEATLDLDRLVALARPPVLPPETRVPGDEPAQPGVAGVRFRTPGPEPPGPSEGGLVSGADRKAGPSVRESIEQEAGLPGRPRLTPLSGGVEAHFLSLPSGKGGSGWGVGARESRLRRVRVALARDPAFCFYYEDNLDLLREAGAELIPFSPLEDPALPEGTELVYLGGGYPEIFAERLAANVALRGAIRRFHAAGGAIFAECGGLMACCRELRDVSGRSFPMWDLIPARVVMRRRWAALGYVTVATDRLTLLGPAGTRVRGHEFHYSTLEPLAPLPFATRALRPDQPSRPDGIQIGGLLAGYAHLHFGSNPSVVRRMLRSEDAFHEPAQFR